MTNKFKNLSYLQIRSIKLELWEKSVEIENIILSNKVKMAELERAIVDYEISIEKNKNSPVVSMDRFYEAKQMLKYLVASLDMLKEKEKTYVKAYQKIEEQLKEINEFLAKMENNTKDGQNVIDLRDKKNENGRYDT